MRVGKLAWVACAAAIALIGCKKPGETPHDNASVAPAAAAAPAPAPAPDASAKAQTSPAFDIDRIPVSTAALGDFPYFSLPAGYTNKHYGSTNKRFARFPFWVDGQAHWVEGRFYGASFANEPGHDFSPLEVTRNFDAMVQQLGGFLVSEGKVPSQETDRWGDEIKMGFNDGLGDVYNNPARTYLIRRNDGNIWLHLVTNSATGGYVVGLEQAFQPSAQLLPASQLKQQIDASGKVALQVNFATDKTDILAESQAQIEQVVQLLKSDPSLKLSINGHTDNSGSAAHNQTLSEGRAKSVVAALVAQGIEAGRLTATGLGDTQPVADNDSAQGKAKNRRVELVKAG